jgi:hypothetical protein
MLFQACGKFCGNILERMDGAVDAAIEQGLAKVLDEEAGPISLARCLKIFVPVLDALAPGESVALGDDGPEREGGGVDVDVDAPVLEGEGVAVDVPVGELVELPVGVPLGVSSADTVELRERVDDGEPVADCEGVLLAVPPTDSVVVGDAEGVVEALAVVRS